MHCHPEAPLELTPLTLHPQTTLSGGPTTTWHTSQRRMRSVPDLLGRHSAPCCTGVVLVTTVVDMPSLRSATSGRTTTWSMPQRTAVSATLCPCSSVLPQQTPSSGPDMLPVNETELQALLAICASQPACSGSCGKWQDCAADHGPAPVCTHSSAAAMSSAAAALSVPLILFQSQIP